MKIPGVGVRAWKRSNRKVVDEASLARWWARRYRLAVGRECPVSLADLERSVGEMIEATPERVELVREVLDVLLEEASQRGSGVDDLSGVVRSLAGRRELLQGLVSRAIQRDGRFGHPWLAELPAAPPPDLVNTVLLSRLKLELKAVQNRRPRTIAAYLTSVEAFARHLGERAASLLDAGPDDVRSYKVGMVSRRNAPATVNQRLAGVKSLYRLLVREKLAGHEILEAFRSMPVEKRIRTLLDAGEVDRLVGAIDESSPLGLRDRAFLSMLFATGARVGELTHLRLDDIDLERGQVVYVTRKNKEDHLALVPEPVLASLRRYVEGGRPKLLERKKSPGPRQELLFLSRAGGPFYRGNANRMVQGYARVAGIRKRVTTHVFRRSVATVLAEAGMPPELIRVFLGHRKLSTTLGSYVAYSRETLRANLEKFHPWFQRAQNEPQ